MDGSFAVDPVIREPRRAAGLSLIRRLGYSRLRPFVRALSPVGESGLGFPGIAVGGSTCLSDRVTDCQRLMIEVSDVEARRLVKEKLDELGIPHARLTSGMVGFADLVRDWVRFVRIHGMTEPHPGLLEVKRMAAARGFRVEASIPGAVE